MARGRGWKVGSGKLVGIETFMLDVDGAPPLRPTAGVGSSASGTGSVAP